MTSGHSAKQIGIYISRCILWMTGVSLILFGAFGIFLGFLEPHGRHGAGGLGVMIATGGLIVIDGVGFLMPQLLMKLLSALLLSGASVYLFSSDAYRREDWWVYCLLFVPLLITVSLRGRKNALPIRELSHAD